MIGANYFHQTVLKACDYPLREMCDEDRMTAAQNGIQSALPLKDRRAHIRNIHYSLTALENATQCFGVLAREGYLHTFTHSPSKHQHDVSFTGVLFAPLQKCVCVGVHMCVFTGVN